MLPLLARIAASSTLVWMKRLSIVRLQHDRLRRCTTATLSGAGASCAREPCHSCAYMPCASTSHSTSMLSETSTPAMLPSRSTGMAPQRKHEKGSAVLPTIGATHAALVRNSRCTPLRRMYGPSSRRSRSTRLQSLRMLQMARKCVKTPGSALVFLHVLV